MLRFLRSTGLTDIKMFIINSRQLASYHSIHAIVNNVEGSGITIFQETNEDPLWEKLEAGNNDMYIYDRCGRLTYYVPHPLSSIDVRHPIIQTAILSTYFDNPCGKECEYRFQEEEVSVKSKVLTSSEVTVTLVGNSSTTPLPPSFNLTSEPPFGSNTTDEKSYASERSSWMAIKVNESVIPDLKAEELIPVLPTEGYGNPMQDQDDGSGSGDGPVPSIIDDGTTVAIESLTATTAPMLVGSSSDSDDNSTATEAVTVLSTTPSSSSAVTLPGPWKIFNFFMRASQKNVTKKTTISVTSSTMPSVSVQNQTEENSTLIPTTTSLWLSSSSLTPRPYCVNLSKRVCAQFSTDRLLRARLCCLKEDIGIDGESLSFGCRRYTKPLCIKMIPLIKCCLKDFSQLLDEYFESRIPNGSPKVQRSG